MASWIVILYTTNRPDDENDVHDEVVATTLVRRNTKLTTSSMMTDLTVLIIRLKMTRSGRKALGDILCANNNSKHNN